jgi:hypothetical protein
VVSGGFIVGFDNDDERIFDEQFEFIQASGIANLSISLLTPLPTTPLYDRLRAEGRLDYGDPELIYIPKQMTREQLKSGFRELLNRVFDVAAYFDRVFDGHDGATMSRRPASARAVRETLRPGLRQRLRRLAGASARTAKLALEMARKGELSRNLKVCPRVLRRNAALGEDAFGFEALVNLWINYWHFASVTRRLSGTEFGTVPKARPDYLRELKPEGKGATHT